MAEEESIGGHRHGGDRRQVGIYPTADEKAAFIEACRLEKTTQSRIGVELITQWTKIILRKHRESE